MAQKCVSAHLRSAWQQKPGVMLRYAKDTITYSACVLGVRLRYRRHGKHVVTELKRA